MNIDFEIDKKVNITTLITVLILFSTLVAGWTVVQSDVNTIKERQEYYDNFRHEVRQNYIQREQLDYMVIQRLDRLERNIDEKLDRIEQAIESRN